MNRTTHTYLAFLMAVMLFFMGNGTTLAHCQHSGQTWFYGFVNDECEEESNCCDEEDGSEDECVETINLSLVSVAASSNCTNVCHIPIFSLLPAFQAVIPLFITPLVDTDEPGSTTACGPPRSVLFRHCILRL